MTGESAHQLDMRMLRSAAGVALRGHGSAEPNPLVGCVIAHGDEIVGWGFHRVYGGAHAEIEALRRAGQRSRDATCYVTLEPCAHTGKTGPCADALIEAGIARVVIGRRDTTTEAGGGALKLKQAGIEVCIHDDDAKVRSVSEPFFHRQQTNRPWVITKWAQTLDGRIATRTGHSQWISTPRSRAMVHRQRSRVDVILTGIGTVLYDDPQLTARCRNVRRTARRVVIDAGLETPLQSKLVQSAGAVPVTIICTNDTMSHHSDRAQQLSELGVEVLACSIGSNVALDRAMELLVERYHAATVLVEAGAGLMGRLFDQQLVNEAWIFIGPKLLGDENALPVARGRTVEQLTSGINLRLIDHRRRDGDVMLRYIVDQSDGAPTPVSRP